MQLLQLKELLEAEVLCGEERLTEDVNRVFASDMMSDVLACQEELECLLTGLVNGQVIRTADMMDIGTIIFVRGKYPPQEIVDMACQCQMLLMVTPCRMFTACGRLYQAGLGWR